MSTILESIDSSTALASFFATVGASLTIILLGAITRTLNIQKQKVFATTVMASWIGGIWGLLNVYALFVGYPNWKKANQKSSDKRLQETKVGAFRLLKTYLFLPLVIVFLLILTLHFTGS